MLQIQRLKLIKLPDDWYELLREECGKPYFMQLEQAIHEEYAKNTIYPPMEQLYTAFYLTPFEEVKVVILGQDPYHGLGQAHGLAFSVDYGMPIPSSLRNIYKELQQDIGCNIPNHGNLEQWAKQGVLLLNTSLTVRAAEPDSHKNMGWEKFSDTVIKKLNEQISPIVFILWGGNARKKSSVITAPQHCVIESAHPSPLSAYRGFWGSKPFSRANEYLQEQGRDPIMWELYEHIK